MITLPNVPAYSFGRNMKKGDFESTPGPADYKWEHSKDKLLRKAVGAVIPRSKHLRFQSLNTQKDADARG